MAVPIDIMITGSEILTVDQWKQATANWSSARKLLAFFVRMQTPEARVEMGMDFGMRFRGDNVDRVILAVFYLSDEALDRLILSFGNEAIEHLFWLFEQSPEIIEREYGMVMSLQGGEP